MFLSSVERNELNTQEMNVFYTFNSDSDCQCSDLKARSENVPQFDSHSVLKQRVKELPCRITELATD